MNHQFPPFTPALFAQQTGLQAADNEAVYMRWLNAQVNYANFVQLQAMNDSLKEIIALLQQGVSATNTATENASQL